MANSNTNSYGGSVTTYGANCHNGPRRAFTHKGINVWAGSHRELQGDLDWALRIRISDGFSTVGDSQVKLSYGAEKLFTEKLLARKLPPTIDIDWPDFEAPDMDYNWWAEVVKGIQSLPEGSNIVVYCMGGHGRTGTALSILAILMGAVPPKEDAVLWLRDQYCQKIVESTAQLRYIEDITGVRIIAKSSFVWTSYGVTENGSATAGTSTTKSAKESATVLIPEHLEDEDGKEEVWVDPKTGTRWLVSYNAAGDVTTMRLDAATQASLPLVTASAIPDQQDNSTTGTK